MIAILNGPLGIGKTQTSWRLIWRFERAALLDCDYIAAVHPFDYYNQDHLDYAYASLAALATHHYSHGFQNLVINWVLETPEQVARLRGALAGIPLPIQVYRLRCDADEIERRVRGRNQDDLAFEVARSRELVAILDVAAQQGDLGRVIDTTALTIEEVVELIWADIHGRQ